MAKKDFTIIQSTKKSAGPATATTKRGKGRPPVPDELKLTKDDLRVTTVVDKNLWSNLDAVRWYQRLSRKAALNAAISQYLAKNKADLQKALKEKRK